MTSAPIGRQIEQLYTLTASGDEAAFASLYVLSDDYRVSIPVRAVATHFLGKLWPHERVLEQLCSLIQNDTTWGEHESYVPVRLEAAEALHNTATSAAHKDWIWTVENRPWFQCLGDMTDDLDAILRDQ